MNQNLKLSLGKLKNLETLYFASQALVASEMLPEEIRKSEYFKNFAKSYDDWVVAFQKAKTNTLTVELVDKFAKIGKLVACIKVIIDSYCNVLKLGDLDANQKALSILSKYKMISKGNRFDIISWTKHFTNELNELGKDNCELMGIQIYIETIQKYLSEYEALYKERSVYSESIKGTKQAAKNTLITAWNDFVLYVQLYNKFLEKDSCTDFILAINSLKKNCDNLDRKHPESNSTTEVSDEDVTIIPGI
jgi:deoxyadenosine/deoxycytidine kinase